MDTASQLRFFINDKPRYQGETRYGDGTATIFQLSGYPIVSGATALGGTVASAFVPQPGDNAWSATGATINYNLGTVTFSGVISAQSAFQVRYTYGTFSDSEIDLVTGLYTDLMSMRLALIDNLMGDAYKRARWAAAGGNFYDDSLTMNNLLQMRSAVRAEMTTEQGPLMLFGSWDTEQENLG